MESNFNNTEFEHYVKSNADQYRMIPSEKVWKGINGTLHTRRKWYGLGLSLLLLMTAVSVTWVMVRYPNSKKQGIALAQDNEVTSTVTGNTDKAAAGQLPTKSILSFNKYSNENITDNTKITPTLPAGEPALNDEPSASLSPETIDITATSPRTGSQTTRLPELITGNNESADLSIGNVTKVASGSGNAEPGSFNLSAGKVTQPNLVSLPLTIESVTNAYKAKKFVRKLTWEVYFTPTVSYRKLSVNKSYSDNVSPFSATNYPFASLRDVNSEVVHKPDMGLELGISTGYPLTKNLRLIGGFQFNINRYDIKAFAYYGEQATIDLNGGNNLTAWTFYRNHDGYKSDWLKNYYFSVSAPVGAEIKLFGNKKTYFGLAGTVQPTYILKDRAFLISTDYKNYLEAPRLIRHLNVNTSLETFISYTSRSAKTRWQIGPQIRYQVLSSFKNPYPVKENLFDFGLKLGVSRNK